MRFIHKFATVAAAAAATVLLAGPASAAVTFDPATGTGFVGKGDVQLAFSWNNADLQSNAKSVAFSYEVTDTYEAVCTFSTGKKVHHIDHKVKSVVASTVAYDLRGKNQITGFTLTGLTGTTSDDEAPVVTGPCMGNEGHEGTWTAVEKTGSVGGLSATFATTTVLLLQQ
jgi:hypothetical protein